MQKLSLMSLGCLVSSIDLSEELLTVLQNLRLYFILSNNSTTFAGRDLLSQQPGQIFLNILFVSTSSILDYIVY